MVREMFRKGGSDEILRFKQVRNKTDGVPIGWPSCFPIPLFGYPATALFDQKGAPMVLFE
jgi:hypothetical protein